MCIYMHIFTHVNAHREKGNAQRRRSHINLYTKRQHLNKGIPMLSPINKPTKNKIPTSDSVMEEVQFEQFLCECVPS